MNSSPTQHHHPNSIGFVPGAAQSTRWGVCMGIWIFHYATPWGVFKAVSSYCLLCHSAESDLLWYGVPTSAGWVLLYPPWQILLCLLTLAFFFLTSSKIEFSAMKVGLSWMRQRMDMSLQINFLLLFFHSCLLWGVVIVCGHPVAVPHQPASTGPRCPRLAPGTDSSFGQQWLAWRWSLSGVLSYSICAPRPDLVSEERKLETLGYEVVMAVSGTRAISGTAGQKGKEPRLEEYMSVCRASGGHELISTQAPSITIMSHEGMGRGS